MRSPTSATCRCGTSSSSSGPRAKPAPRQSEPRGLLPLEPQTDAERVDVDVAAAGVAVAHVGVAVRFELAVDLPREVVARADAEERSGSRSRSAGGRRSTGRRAGAQVGRRSRKAGFSVQRPTLVERSDADRGERPGVRLVVALDRVGSRSARGRAEIELAEVDVSAFQRKIAIQAITCVRTEVRIVNGNIALEGGYVDFGKFDFSAAASA